MRPSPNFTVVGAWAEDAFDDDLLERADEGDGVHVVEEAEVGDAEDLALHFALAVGDDGAEAGFELLDEEAGVDAGGGQDRGGGGGRGVRREERAAHGEDGGAGHGGDGFGVIDELAAAFGDVAGGVFGGAGLGGDPVERGAEGGDERDGGGVGGLAAARVLALLAEVEVVARVVAGFHAVPGLGAYGEVGQAGRDHDGFLRAADEAVDAPGVHVEVRGAEAGDGVDDEEGFGALALRSSATPGTQCRTPVEVSVACMKTQRVSSLSAALTSSSEKVWP